MDKNSKYTNEELEAIRKARNEYMKEYRKKNPDKIKAANMRYWTKKAREYDL